MDFQQTNILSMTGNDDFATAGQLANYVDLTSAQTISGIKTFSALPVSSVVPTTTTQLVNKSYVDGLGAGYVDLTSAQTITGAKTFNANVRLNNTRQLIFGTTYPTAGGVITYSTPNLYYDVAGGGYHNFFVAGLPSVDIDSGGLVIRTSKKVQFYNGSWIYEDSGGNHLDINAPTGYYISNRINNVEQLKLDATNATFTGGIKMKAGQTFIPDDVYVGGSISSGGSGGIRFDADVGANFRFVCDSTLALTIDATNITIPSNQNLLLGITGSSIGYNAGANKIQYKLPTGKSHDFLVNNVSAVIVDASGVVIQSTAVGAAFPTQNLYLSQNKLSYIGSSTTDIRYNCATGGSHNFYQNTSTYLGFWNSTSLTLSPNNVSLQLGTTSTAQIKHDTATSQLQYRTLGSYFHDFFINGTQHFEMNTSGVVTNVGGYRAKNGVSGALDPVYIVISWDGSRSHIWINNTDLGGTAIASDYRLKENIKPARPVLDKLCSIPMIEFEYKDIGIWKKGKGINYGIIAHKLQEAFPEYENLVSCEKDKLTCDGDIQPQSLTSAMNLLFMGSIQELNAKIEAQQKQIDGLVLALSKFMSP